MEASGRRYVRHPSRADVFTIWGLGDLHMGNPGCDLKRIREDVDAIAADPFSLWCGLGDYSDYISPRDRKRFNPEALDNDAKLNIGKLGVHYKNRARDLFAPIRDKCLGLLYGNHEEKYENVTEQQDLHASLCVDLGVPNLRYCALFDVIFQRRPGKPGLARESSSGDFHSQTFRFYAHHGSGSAATSPSKLRSLMNHMANFDADIFLTGHTHDMQGKRLVTLGANADCSKIIHREKVGVICGSYLRTYTAGHCSYGEVRGYSPTALGPAKVMIRPDTREIRAEV